MALSRVRGQIVLAADVCLIFLFNFLLFLPALLRNDIRFINLILHIGLLTGCVLVFQLLFRTYNTLWRYAESREYFVLLLGMSLGFLLYSAVNLLLDTNYCFTQGSPVPGCLLDVLGPAPWYYLWLMFPAMLLFRLLMLPVHEREAD